MTEIDKMMNALMFVLVAMLAIGHVVKGSMWHFGGPGIIILAGMGLMRWGRMTLKSFTDNNNR